jgi:signal peptidase I
MSLPGNKDMSDLTEQDEAAEGPDAAELQAPARDAVTSDETFVVPAGETQRLADETPPPPVPVETPTADAPAAAVPVAEPKYLESGTKAPVIPTEGEGWMETVKTVVYALLIALVIRTFLFQPFNIPSGSMENTLLIGDYLFVEKFAYGYSRYSFPFGFPPFGGRVFASEPHRGDVIVFKMPKEGSPDYMKDFIKRVIGLPGDTVQVINGQVWLNGKAIPKTYVDNVDAEYTERDEFGNPKQVTLNVKRYRETLPGGKSYLVLDERENGDGDNTQIYTVPAGHYFMMGDNRDDSADSRLEVGGFGFVPAQDLEGKAEIIFFSVNGYAQWWEVWKWPWSIRYSKIFNVID